MSCLVKWEGEEKEDKKNMKMSNFHFIPKINVLLTYLLVGVFSACALGFLYPPWVTEAFEFWLWPELQWELQLLPVPGWLRHCAQGHKLLHAQSEYRQTKDNWREQTPAWVPVWVWSGVTLLAAELLLLNSVIQMLWSLSVYKSGLSVNASLGSGFSFIDHVLLRDNLEPIFHIFCLCES